MRHRARIRILQTAEARNVAGEFENAGIVDVVDHGLEPDEMSATARILPKADNAFADCLFPRCKLTISYVVDRGAFCKPQNSAFSLRFFRIFRTYTSV